MPVRITVGSSACKSYYDEHKFKIWLLRDRNKSCAVQLRQKWTADILHGWSGADDAAFAKFILNFQVSEWKKKSSVGPVIGNITPERRDMRKGYYRCESLGCKPSRALDRLPTCPLSLPVRMFRGNWSKSSSVGPFEVFSSMLKSQRSNLHLTSSTLIMLSQNKIPFLASGATANITLMAVVPCGWDLASEGLDSVRPSGPCLPGTIHREGSPRSGSLSVVCSSVNRLVYWPLQLLHDSARILRGPAAESTCVPELRELSLSIQDRKAPSLLWETLWLQIKEEANQPTGFKIPEI